MQAHKNFSSSHESRDFDKVGMTNYPKDNIETDNKLSFFSGNLDKRYGDSAFMFI
jgi:hypothetical protein